ncbi:unnamed protein product [Microthlaspi erraticum]|uniref:J domain-containing protein n=1 Tax=Microthlaspi erraticum TaxID=1685480 RepID=A0A6D2JFI6_9BRAS|nr:unnamed protein product [Microthlaspi erraticum]
MNRDNIPMDEARRMKAFAVQKYKIGDIVTAKQCAWRAKHLNPNLRGIQRLNTLLDVKIGFQKRIKGTDMVDWYAVLGVKPTADVETTKRRYRELSTDLIMDVDSEDSLDSSEAFNILSQSWKVVCVEKKKQYYDRKREIQLRLQHSSSSSSSMSRANPCSSKKKQVRRASQSPSMSLTSSTPVVSPSMIGAALLDKGKKSVMQGLYMYGLASGESNVSSSLGATKIPQDSKRSNAAKRVRFVSKDTDDVVMLENVFKKPEEKAVGDDEKL